MLAMFNKCRVMACDAWRSYRAARKPSIALGFAWPGPNVGGVRRHLDCIARYSRFQVCEYPSATAVRRWPAHDRQRCERFACRMAARQALVHSHVEPAFIRAARSAQLQGQPWVHTYHLMYFKEDWAGQLLPWQEEINRCLVEEAALADVKLCVAAWFAAYLTKMYSINCEVIPNGVDVAACERADASRFRATTGLDAPVLFLNSLAPVKNPLAFVELARSLPELPFAMIGSNLTRAELEAATGSTLPRNLVPLGAVSNPDALDAVAACRAFVMTSHREGLPTALLEAMAMGKPCVAPRAHGCLDALGDDTCGFLYEPGQAEDLVAKTKAALAAEVMPAARQRVLEQFSWDVVMPQIDAVYERLLSRNGLPS